MKKIAKTHKNGDMLPEYDFSGGMRGKHFKRYKESLRLVRLTPENAKHFPDSKAVNSALSAFSKMASILEPKVLARHKVGR